jgi:hypothetical protein
MSPFYPNDRHPSWADASGAFDWLAIQRYPAFAKDFPSATTNRTSMLPRSAVSHMHEDVAHHHVRSRPEAALTFRP